MVAGNNYGACTSLFALLHEIHLVETFALVGRLQLLSKSIIANSTGIHNEALGEDVLKLYRKNIEYNGNFFMRIYAQQLHGQRSEQHLQRRKLLDAQKRARRSCRKKSKLVFIIRIRFL